MVGYGLVRGGAMIGAGVFVLTGEEARENAGPAVVLSYVAAGMTALLSVFCYCEFAVEIPVAGGSFAYLRVELGDFIAFIAAGNIFLDGLVGFAAVGRSWTSYFATMINLDPDQLRISTTLPEDFNLLDPIAVSVMLLAAAIAAFTTKGTSTLNSMASAITLAVMVFIIIAGLINATPSNYSPFMPFGIRGVFRGASVLFFAFLGFDIVATLAEETVNPARDIPLGLFASMSTVTVLYCLMAVTLCLLQNYTEIDVNAPFSSAFSDTVGWTWAQYIVAFGALKSLTTVMLIGLVGQARYVTHIARTHLIPPWFGIVNAKTSTPVNATIAAALAGGVIAFFSSLSVLANFVSISVLVIFMLVALSLLVRRYYVKGQTSVQHQRLLATFLFLILASSAATAIYWVCSPEGWTGYAVALSFWFLSTLGLAVFVPKARKPKFWGVPCMPWIPSCSILANVFLLGSLDVDSFIRFGVWTAMLLVYYVLYGLHSSFDAAHSVEAMGYANLTEDEGESGEENVIHSHNQIQ